MYLISQKGVRVPRSFVYRHDFFERKYLRVVELRVVYVTAFVRHQNVKRVFIRRLLSLDDILYFLLSGVVFIHLVNKFNLSIDEVAIFYDLLGVEQSRDKQK